MLDNEIVKEFVDESKALIKDLVDLLEDIEGDFTQVDKLADYGNRIDRIMGGAKSLAQLADDDHALHLISDYAALCKAVGYKASQIKNNIQFFNICVALLLDATENLDALIDQIDIKASLLRSQVSNTFIERVRWVSSQFSKDYRETVDAPQQDEQKAMNQDEIDDLMKKLGF